MRSFGSVALVAVCLALAQVSCESRRMRPPNILLVVIDTLRADRLGCYGNPRGLTPFMDSLAARGVVFSNVYAASSWTCPSVASLLTSRYPAQHHVVSFASRLAGEEVTLAEKLQPLRYAAGGFSANLRLLESLGYAQGFEHWRVDVGTGGGSRGKEVREWALRWLDLAWRRSSERPGLLYLHYMEPHSPYDPPEPYRSRFARIEGTAAVAEEANRKLVSLRWHVLTREEVTLLESLYDAEVAAVDAELQRLFAELDRRGFLDNAIVVVTADHGEEFWEHGGLMHGTALYEESVRVPLILLAPGLAGGQRIEENVSLIDVAPTLLDLLGAPPEQRFEGRSLAPLLEGGPAGNDRTHARTSYARDVILQLEATGQGFDSREHEAGIVRGAMKLLRRRNGFTEIYDLHRDPEERDANPAVLEGEARALAEALTAAKADLLARTGAAPSPAPIDEATREKLRALGYQF